jgi:hypothetical protein
MRLGVKGGRKKLAPPKKALTSNRETKKTGLCDISPHQAFDVEERHRKEQ